MSWSNFNKKFNEKVDWAKVGEEVMGLDLIGTPGPEGWQRCRSVDGNDRKPSASYNVKNGYYKDWREGEIAISPYDLMYDLGICEGFVDGRNKIAERYGITMPEIDKNDPEFGVKWQNWNDALATQYCVAKPPITVKGLKLSGARMCMRHKVPCFALPVCDYSGQIVGWMFLRRNGQPFENNDAKSICKVRTKDNGAIVCHPLVMEDILSAARGDNPRTVYWTEGPPDMLAGLSMFEEETFITNPYGCSENVEWDGPMCKIILIADCDVPGIAGAFKRARPQDRVLHPPGEITEKHGKDYRDFLSENPKTGKPDSGLLDAAHLRKEISEKDRKKEEEELQQRRQRAYTDAEKFIESTGCHITMVEGETLHLYSEYTCNEKKVPQIDRLTYESMIQFLGWEFQNKVVATHKDVEAAIASGVAPPRSFIDFKRALALSSTNASYKDLEYVGAGIWPVESDVESERTGDILIVTKRAVYQYSGKHVTKLKKPVVGRFVASTSTKYDWFKYSEMSTEIQRSHDPKYRQEAYTDVFSLLGQWNWEHPDMLQVSIGLVMASWIQSLLKWRPNVAVIGESNSGKSTLFTVLNHLFLSLAQFSAQSTAAGVLQNMGIDARPLLLDEFDSGSEQAKLLKHFRVSSRGQEMLKGTAGQSGKTYRIQHIPWLSGIHAASKDQADMNRMIPLRILSAPENKVTFKIPPAREIQTMGRRILAGVIVTSQLAMENISKLTMSTKKSDIQSRYRESYAVPYGCLAALLDLDIEGVDEAMTEYLNTVVANDVFLNDAASDQESLLLDILGSEVKMPFGSPEDTASVAEILFSNNFIAHRNEARVKGVGFILSKNGKKKVAFAGGQLISKSGLLRGTRWENVAGILQILSRLPSELEPKKEKQNIACSTVTCVCVDYDKLKVWINRNGQATDC